MPKCWFSMLPDAGPCDGRLVRCHLIPRQTIRREAVGALPRGVELRDGERPLDSIARTLADGPRPIARHRLPPGLEEFAAELGLEWWLDYTYGPRWDEVEHPRPGGECRA
jgi:hypothetical protein